MNIALEAIAPLNAPSPLAHLNPLAKLRDIHLPEPISLWPSTIAWWILAGLFLVIVGYSIFLYTQRINKYTYRNEALQHLKAIETQYVSNADYHQLVNDLSELMRRICLSLFPRKEVAGLTGLKWLKFLDDKGHTHQFCSGNGADLIEYRYSPLNKPFNNTLNKPFNNKRGSEHKESPDAANLIDICRKWIATQK